MMGQRYDEDNYERWGNHEMSDGRMMGNNQGMMGGMNGMDMMVRSEKEFLTGMIPHHEEAVKTAKEVIARGGTTPRIKALAKNIVKAQEAEIANMKNWYQAWYNEAYVDKGTYQPMMRNLTNLSGTTLDRTFLEDMVMHHMGAIMMARSVEPYIEHQEMTNLTKSIIDSQTNEIGLMRELLRSL
jgi:uncharacterized protein (DUF305 family)